MQRLRLATAHERKLAGRCGVTAIEPKRAETKAIHLRGEGCERTIDAPGPAQAETAAKADELDVSLNGRIPSLAISVTGAPAGEDPSVSVDGTPVPPGAWNAVIRQT